MTRKPKQRRRRSHEPAVELIPIDLPDGRRGVYVSDVIRESDPPAVREGIARRRVLAMTGECPCGARSLFDPLVISPVIGLAEIEHESDCPAAEENLNRAMRDPRGGAR